MVQFRHMLAAFVGGEIDPHMHGRVDSDQYTYGLELCENFIAINEGPLVKRPGFYKIRDAAATAAWLGAFRYSVTQEYVIEWSNTKARFFTNGARIETAPNIAYEITTPYLAADCRYLSTAQSFDRLYIDHADYPPAALSRLTAITFSHANTDLVNGPFLDQNTDQTIEVTVSNVVPGATTIFSSAAIFDADMVGGLFEIEAKDFSDLKAWEPGMKAVVIGGKVRSDGKAYIAESAGVTGSIQPIHTDGSEWDGQAKLDEINSKGPYGIKWKYVHGRRGIVKITGFTDPTEVTGTVLQHLPESVTSVPTFRWAHGAFSNSKGWPSLVLTGFGRQIHFKDFDIHGSVVGDYGGGRVNFARFTDAGLLAPDMAFRRTIATEDPPLWATLSSRKMVVGTASKELAIGAINSALAVSGDNISADPQSFYGSERVFPVLIGTEAVFVERGGRRLRASDYDFGRDRYAAIDMTAAARHITKSGVIQMAYSRVPWPLLYGVREDGQLIAHCNTKLEIKGFSRMILGGGAKVLSAVSIVGADGKTDELWCLVERTRADGVKREIWKQANWHELGDPREEVFFVDGGVRAEATAGQTVFTGLTHLAGQAVAVLANGGVVPGLTVDADGELTLPATSVPDSPYTLIVGLPYTAQAITLRPEVRQRGETVQGVRQQLKKLVLRVLDTIGIQVGDRDGPVEEIIDRAGDGNMDEGIPLFSGDTAGDIDGQFDRRGQAQWISSDPLPCVVSAAMMVLEVDQSNG
ncbi:hypothetical protein [Sphingorhabdus sp.]|jgi:hypothetical protein|uniref:hypothetical protein n=1 Tax=Sphingorhabdus sp. TaxID=1902408 RepID=UPI0037CAC02A